MRKLFASRNSLIVLALLILFSSAWHIGLLDAARHGLYDAGQSIAGPLSNRGVVMVAIDDTSIQSLNDYPVSENVRAKAITQLFKYGAHQVAWLDLPSSYRPGSDPARVLLSAGRLINGMPVVVGHAAVSNSQHLPAYVRQFAIDSSEQRDVRPMQAQTVIPWPVSVSNASTVYAPYPVSTYSDSRTRTAPLIKITR
jgi:hypothetical protein